jgi:16S rRNA (adenine1518-N6/adenine1519-N6)-dimethyltransferase
MDRTPARRRWGQHFLVDGNVARRIVETAAILRGETVLEVGPGEGALTERIARAATRLLAIEIDPIRADALSRRLSGPSVRIVAADARRQPISAWLREAGWPPPAVIVANLPYNVATALLSDWVTDQGAVSRMIVMVQREVADRLTARPGDASYGYLSVKMGLYASCQRQFEVPPGAFRPRPAVVSAVVRVVPDRAAPDGATLERALTIASAAFTHRRKTLANAAADLIPRQTMERALRNLGHGERVRAEDLGPAQYVALAREFAAAAKPRP